MFQEKKNKVLLEETDRRLLEFLIAEFETTAPEFPDDPMVKLGEVIVAAYKQKPESLNKSDIFKLDMLILNLQSTERLVQRAENLRIKYSEIAGAKLAQAYHPTPTPTPDKLSDPGTRKLLLADLQQLLYFIHWNYFFSPIRERLRNNIVKSASIHIAIYTFIWTIVTYCIIHWQSSNKYQFVALCVTVAYAGLIGGFISSQRRMQMVPTDGDALSSIYTLENGRYFLWFAPLTGAVFSIVLMILFMSGLVKGGLFPEFADTSLLPKDPPKDYALLFFWSFIAGFAERFVPDALDRIISRGEEAIKTPAPKPANASGGDEKGKTLQEEELNKSKVKTAEDIQNDQHVDGDVETNEAEAKPDEALPAAEGGVAK